MTSSRNRKTVNSSLPMDHREAPRFILALAAIIPGMMMVMIDSTAMNVAIPGLSNDFHVPFSTLQWIITGYMLAMAITIPLAGGFSDTFGAATALIYAVMLFMLGSLLCAAAQNVEQLIIYRVVQGLGGGMIQPIGMATIFRIAPPEKKGQIMGMLGIPMLIAPASGPVLSGWLIQHVSWHWIFWINLPLGMLTIILIQRHLSKWESLKPSAVKKQSFDILGLFLAPAAFTLLVLSLNLDTYPWVVGVLGMTGMLLIVCLWFHESKHPHPLLELRAFRTTSFRRGVWVSWIQYMALNGSIVFIPQFLQNFKGYTPLQAGLVMSMLAITSGVIMPLGGKLFDRFGIRPLAMIGLGLISISLLLLSQVASQGTWIGIAGIVGLLGVGMGFCMMSLNTYILQSAPAESISRVTPLTSAGANLIIPISIAGLSQFLAMRESARAGSEVVFTVGSRMDAYTDTFLLAAGIAMLGVILSVYLRPHPKWK